MQIRQLYFLTACLTLDFFSQVNSNPSILNNLRDFYNSLTHTSPTDGACVPQNQLVSSISQLDQARQACTKTLQNLSVALTLSAAGYQTSSELLRRLALECPRSGKYCPGIIDYKDKSADFKSEIHKLNNAFSKYNSAVAEAAVIAKTSVEPGNLIECSVEDGKIHRMSESHFDHVYIPKSVCTEVHRLKTQAEKTLSVSESAIRKIGTYIGHAVMFMTLKIPELQEIPRLSVPLIEKFKKSVDVLQKSLKQVLSGVSAAESSNVCDFVEVKLQNLASVVWKHESRKLDRTSSSADSD